MKYGQINVHGHPSKFEKDRDVLKFALPGSDKVGQLIIDHDREFDSVIVFEPSDFPDLDNAYGVVIGTKKK
jgi:hypothetical protein